MYAARDAPSAAVDALRAAQAELEHRLRRAPPGTTRAAFVAISVWKLTSVSSARLDELRLRDRPPHAQDRLVREHDGALGHAVHVTVKRIAPR